MIQSSIIITCISLLCSCMGFFVQMLIANKYGTGLDVDAYFYAISGPIFLSGMIASLLSYAVVPIIARENQNTNNQNKLINSILGFCFVLTIIIIMVSPILMWLQTSQLPSDSRIHLLKYMQSLYFLSWCIASVQILLASACAILVGLKQPIYATLLGFGPYIGMLGSLLLVVNSGVDDLALGLLTGTTASLALAIYNLRRRIVFAWKNIAWTEISSIVSNAPYTMIAMSCFSAYSVIDSYWAPHAEEGVLATLGYSQRIIIALGNLAVAGPSAVFAAKITEFVADGNLEEFYNMLWKILGSTSIIACLLAGILYVSGEPLVGLLFVRGAFDHNDVAKVAIVLKYCLPGMIFMLLSVICMRILFCFNNVEKKAAALGVLWFLLYFLLSGLLIKHSSVGIAVAYSLTWLICFLYVAFVIFSTIRNHAIIVAKNNKKLAQ